MLSEYHWGPPLVALIKTNFLKFSLKMENHMEWL